MATITLKGQEIHTEGELPRVGARAPDFVLTDKDLKDVTLASWFGKRKLLSVFPSIDTPVCALSTRKFSERAEAADDVVLLMISADLPFAHSRFCVGEELENVVTLSTMRHDGFPMDYGVAIVDGPLRGLLARAVVVLDENNTVVHSELVSEVSDEPDYETALKALGD